MKHLTLILLLLLLVIVPTIFAFDCHLTSNLQQCTQIVNANINESQKEVLLETLFYNYTNFPNHEFIFNYNTKIKVDSNIENLNVVNSNYIKNTWLSLLTIMPSVLENNELYVPNNAFVLSEYNYEVYIPENY